MTNGEKTESLLLDSPLIDGIMSLRQAGFLIAWGFALGLQIGHGAGRIADIKELWRVFK